MSVPAKRWARLAEDLEFEQLTGARKQAEGWRTGLTSLTAVLAAVTIVKGTDSVADLAEWLRYTVVALLAAAFLLLVIGSLAATRAASGDPGAEIFLEGDELRAWTLDAARSVQKHIVRATRCMLLGLSALALATGLTWLGPRASEDRPLVTVEVDGNRLCGTLLAVEERTVILGDPAGSGKGLLAIPFRPGIEIRPAERC